MSVMKLNRRAFVTGAARTTFLISSLSLSKIAKAAMGPPLPASVAGIPLPDTAVARAAAALARGDCPDFLFNHSVRTYLFGALFVKQRNLLFDHEKVFVASALHDFGLLSKYATKNEPFEIDGAEAAKAFLEKRGVASSTIDLIWDAIAMHASPIGRHKPLEVRLVGAGAAADVFGGGIDRLTGPDVAHVMAAFPRLSFNVRFRNLLLDHCNRKPLSTASSWLESFCREHSHGVTFPSIDEAFRQSPFKE